MADLSTVIERTLTEELLPTIESKRVAADKVYPRIKSTSMGVQRDKQGRGHKVIKTFSIGVAGGAKFRSLMTSPVVSGPNNFNAYGDPNGYPTIGEVTAPSFFYLETSLIEHVGNIFIPGDFMRTDQYSASIGSVIAKNMQGVAELVNSQECAMFYTNDTYRSLGDIGDTSATVTNGSDTSSVVVNLAGTNASGRIHRLRPGMLIDLYKSDGTVKRNAGFLLAIDDVDVLNAKITLRRVDGSSFQTTDTLNGGVTFGGSGADDDIIVIKDSISLGANGLNTWIVDSGTLFGLTLANKSLFKSYKPSSEGAVLSESRLNARYYKFYEAYPDKNLDTAITTMGALLGLIDNLEGSSRANARYDRNGEKLTPNLGFNGFNYSFGDRDINVVTSTWVTEGEWYAVQLANNNLKRYIPPALPGAGYNSEVGNELEFIAPTMGSKNIFLPALLPNSAVTDFVQAPFRRQWQVLPDDPVSMKLTGITPITVP